MNATAIEELPEIIVSDTTECTLFKYFGPLKMPNAKTKQHAAKHAKQE